MNNKLCIVIPHHRTTLLRSEEASFKRVCKKFAHKYPVYIILPKLITNDFRNNYFEIIQKFDVQIIQTNDNELSSYGNYNKYLCSKKFYSFFDSFEYMLLYQLDAWVLNGEIEPFLDLNYDYIGAPIFKHDFKKPPIVIEGGGNGGVSLRKIETALKILSDPNCYFTAKYYFKKIGYDYTFMQNPIKFIIKKYLSNFLIFKSNGKIWPFAIQEDVFWSVIIPSKFEAFRVPSLEDSAKFAYDLYPKVVYQYSNCLPLFIHAWEKNNDGFFEQLYLNENNDIEFRIKE